MPEAYADGLLDEDFDIVEEPIPEVEPEKPQGYIRWEPYSLRDAYMQAAATWTSRQPSVGWSAPLPVTWEEIRAIPLTQEVLAQL